MYEGYLLYPYHRSSQKNRVRWQFGVLAPRAWAEAHGPEQAGIAGSAEWWWQQTEVVLRASAEARIEVCVRFLQVERRLVEVRGASGYRPADCLEVEGRRYVSTEGARPVELAKTVMLGELVDHRQRHEHAVRGARDAEPLVEAGREVGRLVVERAVLRCAISIGAEPAGPPGFYRLSVRTANAADDLAPGASRPEALRRSLVATHTVLAGAGCRFVSAVDPPPEAAAAVAASQNLRTFPVLAGPDLAGGSGSDEIVLSAPIILEDHPRLALESPGDLHDACEIDEILTLRTMTLSDDEKAEARATDPRAAQILDRVDSMPSEVLARLHGTVCSVAPPPSSPPPPFADRGEVVGSLGASCPSGIGPGSSSTGFARGERVVLRPRREGGDAHDMFLEGRSGRVEAVLEDLEGGVHLVVSIEDDPLAELEGAVGRYRYFRPEELEPALEERRTAR